MFDFSNKNIFIDDKGYEWEYFGDTSNHSLFYIAPHPTIFAENKVPHIDLIEYQTNDSNNGSGYLHLDIELVVPEEIKRSIALKIENDLNLNPSIEPIPFEQGGTVDIDYQVENKSFILTAPVIAVNGNFIASFVERLDGQSMLVFISALSDSQSHDLKVDYHVKVNTLLQGVDCTLTLNSAQTFVSQIGADITKSIATCDILAIVDEHLDAPSSPACSVNIISADQTVAPQRLKQLQEWGKMVIRERVKHDISALEVEKRQLGCHFIDHNQSDYLGQELLKKFNLPQDVLQASNRWMQNELGDKYQVPVQKLVAAVEEQVDCLVPAKIENINSFQLKFLAQNTVPWFLDNSNPLSLVSSGCSWPSCFKILNQKQFLLHVIAAVDFSVISKIDAWVDYANLPANKNTYEFSRNSVAHLFSCAYDNKAGDSCRFSYIVHYIDQQKPPLLIIWPNVKDQAPIVINPTDSGHIKTTFDAGVVNFDTQVESISVSFFYQNSSANTAPLTRQFELNNDTRAITVQSIVERPINNPYVYTVTYQLKNGEQYAAPCQTSNAETIYLLGPVLPYQQGFLLADHAHDAVAEVQLNVYYINAQNNKVEQAITLTPDKPIATMDVYSADGITLPIHYQGVISHKETRPDTLVSPTTIVSSIVVIDPDYRYISLKLDASQIKWEQSLVQFQFNVSAHNSTSNAMLTRSFLFTKFHKSVRYWGYYTQRQLPPAYQWNGVYSFNGWFSIYIPAVPGSSAGEFLLPDTPSADKMRDFINMAHQAPGELDAQAMASALSASPYLPIQVSPVIKAHYGELDMVAIISQAFGFTLASRNNIASLAVALKVADCQLDTAISLIKSHYQNECPEGAGDVITQAYSNTNWGHAQSLASDRVSPLLAAPQLMETYSMTTGNLLISIASAYDLASASANGMTIARAMKNAGSSLDETSAAMNLQCSPAWTPVDYGQVLDAYNWY